MSTDKIIWQPQPGPQTALLSCPIFEIFYGGARGGGKTDGSLGDWLQHAHECGPAARGIFLRRVGKQLEEVVARAHSLFPLLGATWREQKGEFKFPSGARLKFRHLERDSDAEHYQGHSYSRVYVEEATNFPSPEPINKMRATVRSPEGAAVGMRLTGNPGGPGHQWVKDRYITPCKTGYQVLQEKFFNPFTKEWILQERVFIPSRLSDNAILMKADPGYVARLQQQGSDVLVRAWLDGDWDIVLGAFFDCFSYQQHVLSMEWLPMIPKDALRFRAFDWGSAKPFSVGWYAVSDGTWGLPRGALVKYREWYGMKPGQPNVGLKMDAELVAQGIKERETGEHIKYGVAGRDIFIRDGGPSIAERMLVKGITWRPADTKRQTGWDQMRHYLTGNGGVPLLYFLSSCEDSIRTIPSVPHDEHNMEDVDTESEDHAADETRYAVMSRQRIARDAAPAPRKPPPGSVGDMKTKHFAARRAAREEMRV